MCVCVCVWYYLSMTEITYTCDLVSLFTLNIFCLLLVCIHCCFVYIFVCSWALAVLGNRSLNSVSHLKLLSLLYNYFISHIYYDELVKTLSLVTDVCKEILYVIMSSLFSMRQKLVCYKFRRLESLYKNLIYLRFTKMKKLWSRKVFELARDASMGVLGIWKVNVLVMTSHNIFQPYEPV